MARSRLALAVAAAASLAGCGGMGGGGDGTSATVTVSAAGLTPRSVEVMSEGCLLFRNTDAVAHQMQADDGAMCSELMQAQPLAPGATWTACMSMGPKTCSFRDVLADAAAAGAQGSPFAGTIQVDAPMAMPMMMPAR
jgi:hypothetical protein